MALLRHLSPLMSLQSPATASIAPEIIGEEAEKKNNPQNEKSGAGEGLGEV